MSALLLGDEAPDFEATTQFGRFGLYDWQGSSWVVLFSHPADFTPTCSTEIAEIARLAPEFARRGVKVATISTGTVDSHIAWAADLTRAFGPEVDFPLISDPKLRVARLYGMVHPRSSDISTIRSVFIIDPEHRVRLVFSYPHTTGRNFAEILRAVDSLQLADEHAIATPANWTPGDRVLIHYDIPEEQAVERWGAVDAPLPYIRLVDIGGTPASR